MINSFILLSEESLSLHLSLMFSCINRGPNKSSILLFRFDTGFNLKKLRCMHMHVFTSRFQRETTFVIYPVCFPAGRSLPKTASSLNGKNIILQEQFISLRGPLKFSN